jgi:hypothetical protein
MEGAENFDFYRQPDFVKEPFLRGSYAVYKKETLVGEGTGKLCHIHRPQIIDARGRRCWGDLSVVGNELSITIPEQWLSKAKYPVIVDPTIGTTTVGSQTAGPDPNNSYHDRPWIDGEFTLNKYLVPQNGNGICTAFVYCYNTETETFATPILYTNENNKPYMKKSQNENDIHVSVWPPGLPVGWRSNSFTLNGNIAAGEYVWFGVFSSWFTTRFDYGGECYKFWPDWDGEELPSYLQVGAGDTFCNIKWSWYFSYEATTSQNYIRTLTQGVSLPDNRTVTANYKRTLAQITSIFSVASTLKTICRKCIMAVGSIANTIRKAGYNRYQTETVKAEGVVRRGLLLFVHIVTGAFVRDYILSRFLKAKVELTLKSCVTREIVLESRIN